MEMRYSKNIIREILLSKMLKNTDIWISPYLFTPGRKVDHKGERHILFSICDHFEPYHNKEDEKQRLIRMKTWIESFPNIARKHRDANGYPPQITFFYPAEQYYQEYLSLLAKLCHGGYGEVEIHLHHDNDTGENLRKNLIEFKKTLALKHGLLSQDRETGETCYGFIHGNWTLDNSRPDGRWCGVNNELIILQETGCYADFTLPSAPSATQTRKINSIYYAIDNPLKPKSHNTGVDVKVGEKPTGNLMIIQGPLALNFKSRKYGILPRIENSQIGVYSAPTPERIDLWIRQRIHVIGKLDWIFVKIHSHGAHEENMNFLLKDGFDKMFSYLEQQYNDGKAHFLHYVTAREMYNIIKAAEAGYSGNPNDFRDFILVRTC